MYRSLGASEGAMKKTLSFLMEAGWVEKNPGYGHPLRPEYILTKEGKPLAEACSNLVDGLAESSLLDGKWQLPALSLLESDASFGEIRSRLPGATDRAISLALKSLMANGAIQRTVTEDFPPQARYQATPEMESVPARLDRVAKLL